MRRRDVRKSCVTVPDGEFNLPYWGWGHGGKKNNNNNKKYDLSLHKNSLEIQKQLSLLPWVCMWMFLDFQELIWQTVLTNSSSGSQLLP